MRATVASLEAQVDVLAAERDACLAQGECTRGGEEQGGGNSSGGCAAAAAPGHGAWLIGMAGLFIARRRRRVARLEA